MATEKRMLPSPRRIIPGSAAIIRKAPATSDIAINRRESAIVSLRARGTLTDQQYEAVLRFEALFRVLEDNLRAADPARLRVDGGIRSGAMGDHVIDAGRKLADARRCSDSGPICCLPRSAGRGHGLRDAGYGDSKRMLCSVADLLRWSLDDLGERWGLGR